MHKPTVNPATQRAFRFFAEHTGGIVGEQAKGALAYARAERAAKEAGVVFVWSPDRDADWSWLEQLDENTGRYLFARSVRKGWHEVEQVLAVIPCNVQSDLEHDRVNCDHAETIGSLSGIFDATGPYRRTIEAELALEALDTIKRAHQPLGDL